MKKKGFTLIELLIVVAIIAILAAIAIPNLLEAQTRAKVSRGKADMRTLATAIEARAVDENKYPFCNTFSLPFNNTAVGGTEDWAVLEDLSTPVSYITNGLIKEPFEAKLRTGGVYNGNTEGSGDPGTPGIGSSGYSPVNDTDFYYHYQSGGRDTRGVVSIFNPVIPVNWEISSTGPDLITFNMGGILQNNSLTTDPRTPDQKIAYVISLIYDPTNGTLSFGEIFRSGGSTDVDYAVFFFKTVQQNQ